MKEQEKISLKKDEEKVEKILDKLVDFINQQLSEEDLALIMASMQTMSVIMLCTIAATRSVFYSYDRAKEEEELEEMKKIFIEGTEALLQNNYSIIKKAVKDGENWFIGKILDNSTAEDLVN